MAERIMGDHQRDLWMFETRTGQQVAQLLVSWMTMKMIMKFMTM